MPFTDALLLELGRNVLDLQNVGVIDIEKCPVVGNGVVVISGG